ncbi:unnamed protein product [Bursaphelenchus xylophilus]|uniref:Amino acid transporter n=1 Tax=Bursaphelenchus xylophilus TaxID=6326 RepID=A0A1I7RW86_BURXY|nr:unnamed protein product [Bursaphelenchus xylophilus]CAG9095272.1 unnamed protein product [Bursaphelenchus xylophilus]
MGLRDNKEHMLLALTLAGVVIGCAIGFLSRLAHPSDQTIEYIGFPGVVLMNMLKMTILPLVAASLISGLSQLDAKQSGRIGGFAFCYYGMTTTLAVATGIALVLIIHPGDPTIRSGNLTPKPIEHTNVTALDKILDLIRNMFPDNIVQSSFNTIDTHHEYFTDHNGNDRQKLVVEYHMGMNVLGIIVFCIATGLIISFVGEKAKPLADFFVALDIVITTMVGLIMWYSPVGIASLIAEKILEIDDIFKTVKTLAMYMITVIAGLAIHLFVTIPTIYFLASRKNPFVYMRGLGQAMATALGTGSSAASLPATFRCLEQNNKCEPRFTKFVLPVGAMINMDGTALYEAVASIFIAQLNDISLSIGQVLTVSLTATLASIGAASIPSAGLVTMLIVLTAVGLPVEDISLIFAVDWFLDRLRTCVNVTGDGFGVGFVQAMCTRGEVAPTLEATPTQVTFLASNMSEAKFFNSLDHVDRTKFEESTSSAASSTDSNVRIEIEPVKHRL